MVIYHAFPSALSGGFVGVDIFFVISGYLISSIVFKGLDSEVFSFRDFFSRRIRRIFPALIVVLAASLVFGWYAMLGDEFKKLGKHVFGGAAFVSNFYFWDELDYFDTRAELKPLLHLWSLGVEEQFYIVWPLLLFLAWRVRSTVPALILAIIFASFLLNIGTIDSHAAAVFYLPFARFWELLSGGLLAYLTLLRDDPVFGSGAHPRLRALLAGLPAKNSGFARRVGDFMSLVGAMLICLAVIEIDRQSAFPGWWALLPTSGALLLIAAGPGAFINRFLLARNTMVFVGLISYPLYLWHWPLFSFARVIGEASQTVIICLVGVSIFLAWATYRFIELPVKRRSFDGKRAGQTTRLLAWTLAAIALVGLAIWGRLLPGRLDAVSQDILEARLDYHYPGDGVVGDKGEGTILFFGDSYIQQYYPRIELLSHSGAWAEKTLLFKTAGGCAPYIGLERLSQPCNAWAQEGYELAEQGDVEAIVLGACWTNSLNRGDYYRMGDSSRTVLDLRAPENDWVFKQIEDSVRSWLERNKRVYIILSNPDGPAADPGSKIPSRLAWDARVEGQMLSLDEHLKKNAFVHDRLRQIAESTGATVIDPALALCDGDICKTEMTSGAPMYCDDGHLRGSFVRDKVLYLDAIVGDAAVSHAQPGQNE